MSQENVEIVSKALEAFNRDGVEAALPYLDEEIEWIGPPEWLEEHVYNGHEDMRRLTSQWSEQIDEYRVEPERFIDVGDAVVVVLAVARGRIKGSTVPIEQKVSYVWEVRDGKGWRVQVYFSWEGALEAAGLSE